MASVNNDPVSTQPKILLVDDREDNLLSIEAILAPDRYQFFRAYSGHQALKILLNEFDFAMILMDVKMPVLNGFETATLIYERERLRHIPIIFITANNYGDENIFKGYRAGGTDYIFKPINPEVLRAKVAVFIDLYRKNTILIEQEQVLSSTNKKLENEIKELKASQEKIRQRNDRFQNEIRRLESLLIESKSWMDKSKFEQVDLNELIKGFLDDMNDQVIEKMATVLVEPLPRLTVSPFLMRPLFQNLIRNTLMNSKNAKPVINIRAETGASQEGVNSKNKSEFQFHNIIIENKSNGQNTVVTTLSDELQRANGREVDNGLAICKKIMDGHSGFIFASDQEEEGAAFIISFPVAD